MATDSICCNPAPLKPIAFHAEIKSDRTYKGGSVWIYENVVTNEGGAYNPATGKFTVPRKGLYLFTWYTLSNPSTSSHAGLYVNGKIKGRQASNNADGGKKWITSGSNIALALKEGDEVFIMDAHGWTSQIRGLWTSFGGVQIS
ncbi:complement C1q-like protein 4 [Saccostrea echinata]|uniref:complement C1q-like protein 4 n=1 Tax=Saccostrea echinata TaxID=191078 RepID=UPI002A837EFE|nr:complement C1q-like protein 4 [Saccostrea echinata]